MRCVQHKNKLIMTLNIASSALLISRIYFGLLILNFMRVVCMERSVDDRVG